MKKKLKLKKMAPGGQNPPITVSDPNDPRLRAYQDSLDLYNFGEDAVNRVKNSNYYIDTPPPQAIKNSYLRLEKLNGIEPKQFDILTRKFPQSSGATFTNTAGHFTQPVQPYQFYADDNGDGLNNKRKEQGYHIEKDSKGVEYPVFDNKPRPKEDIINFPKYTPLQLDQTISGRINYTPEKLPLPKPDWFSRPKQSQETGDKTQYFDKQTGKQIDMKKMNLGGVNNSNLIAMYGKSCRTGGLDLIGTKSTSRNFYVEYGGMIPKAGTGYYDDGTGVDISSNMLTPQQLEDPNYITPYSNDAAIGNPLSQNSYPRTNQYNYPHKQEAPVEMQSIAPTSISPTTSNPATDPTTNTNSIQKLPASTSQSSIPGNPPNYNKRSMYRPQYQMIGAGSGADFKIGQGSSQIAFAKNSNMSGRDKGLSYAGAALSIASGAGDIIGDIMGGIGQGRHDARVESEWYRRRKMANDPMSNPNYNADATYATRGGNSTPAYGSGGVDNEIHADPNGATIEGENNEWARTKQGQIKKFVGDPHGKDTDGDGHEGIPTSEAQEIISAKLPIGADVSKAVKTQFGLNVKSKKYYSDIMEAFNRKNHVSDNQAVLENPKSDDIAKRTAQMNLSKIEPEQQALHNFTFHTQETKKMLGGYDHIDSSISKETVRQHMSGDTANPLANFLKEKAAYGYQSPNTGSSSNVSTTDDPYFTPEDRASFAATLWPGDANNKWNASPFLNNPEAGMTQLFKAGFKPPKDKEGHDDWSQVDPEKVQDFIYNKDSENGFPILQRLYETYGDTNQGEDKHGKGMNWKDMTAQDKKDFFNDDKYGVRTGLAQLFVNPNSVSAPQAAVAPTTTTTNTNNVTSKQYKFNFKPSNGKNIHRLGPQASQFLPEIVAMSNLGRRQVVYNQDRGAEEALASGTNYQRAPVFDQNRNDVWSAFRTKLGSNRGDTPSIRNSQDSADYATTLNELNRIGQQDENSQRQTYNASNEFRNRLLLEKGRNKQAATADYEDKSNRTDSAYDKQLQYIAESYRDVNANLMKDNWDYQLKQSLAPNIDAPVNGPLRFDPNSSTYFSMKPFSALDQQMKMLNTEQLAEEDQTTDKDGNVTTKRKYKKP